LKDWILGHEPALRVGSFVAVFAIMALWELVAARRELSQSRGRRWFANLTMLVVGTLLIRVVFPAAAVGAALVAEGNGWGLFNLVELPRGLSVALSFVLLDLTIYLQHQAFHAVPVLWRLHMVHHTDQDFDVTTGIRFHPIEIAVSMLIKFAAILVLGAPPEAVLIFEVVLNATSVFNHGNVRLPRRVDRWLRWAVVTPDMHRVHHSVEVDESNHNFGFNLPWWDRLFGTYRAQPRAGHDGMTIGVDHLRQAEPFGLMRLLAMPFVAETGAYPSGRRSPPRSGTITPKRAGTRGSTDHPAEGD
jgi:sterol desaturase/sphingolipid hydroxylase (fatty acid hydroxylase superfamily)